MRARNIKPGICKNYELADISAHARLLFIYLWMMADREGRLLNQPRKIGAECFPYEHALNIESLLSELDTFLDIYGASSEFIQIINFTKHQNPHKNEKTSDIPSVEDSRVITGQVPSLHNTNPADSLIEDSLIEDSLITDTGPTGDDDQFYKMKELSALAVKYLGWNGNLHQGQSEALRPLTSIFKADVDLGFEAAAQNNVKSVAYVIKVAGNKSATATTGTTKFEELLEASR